MLITDRSKAVSPKKTRHVVAIAVAVAVLAAAGEAGYAAGNASQPTISACVQHANGVFYAADRCRRHDTRLSWNAEGPAGPTGAQGPAGPPGDPGVIAVAQNGGADPPGLGGVPAASRTLTDTVLTTSRSGSLVAVGHVDLQVDCGPLICGFTAGLYVDGQPVPGSAHAISLPVFGVTEETFDLFGVAPGLPAGTHHVTIGLRAPVHLPTITAGSETHSAAIALAG